jgi:hypothetical protein
MKIKKNYLQLLLLFFIGLSVRGQALQRQMISAQGKSTLLTNGMWVSQTIGQQSAIGNHSNGFTVGQGFQQSKWEKYVSNNIIKSISTITYPNPFVSSVNFKFSQPISDKIQISVFDIRGRIVFQEQKYASETVLNINLSTLASSNYLVRLTASNFIYYSQIIKQND